MNRNDEWHANNKLIENPTLDQSVRWHIDHARNCPCPASDGQILEELKKRYSNTHQEFWIYFNIDDHKHLALWAVDCAERVLPIFAEKYPADTRPQDAIRILRDWVNTGKFSMQVIRGASLAAHAAAREADQKDNAARLAARAAGQAVATAHVPTHAFGSALYAIKAIAASNPDNVAVAMAKERDWQDKRIPENLSEWVASGLSKYDRLLPKNLRINNETIIK